MISDADGRVRVGNDGRGRSRTSSHLADYSEPFAGRIPPNAVHVTWTICRACRRCDRQSRRSRQLLRHVSMPIPGPRIDSYGVFQQAPKSSGFFGDSGLCRVFEVALGFFSKSRRTGDAVGTLIEALHGRFRGGVDFEQARDTHVPE
jgi:hypothetical protein